jgi:hypothetical protein
VANNDYKHEVPKTNRVASTLKNTAIIGGILSFIGWIIIGVDTDSFQITLYGWVGTFVSCLLLFAIGEIISQLSISNNNANITKQQNMIIIQALNDSKKAANSNFNRDTFEDLPNL